MAPTNPFLQSPFQTLIDQQEQAKPLPGAQQVKEAQPLPDLSADPVPAKAGTPASAPAAAPATDNLLPPDTLRPLFEATAAHFKVPVNVLMAIAHQESRYRPDAVNPASGAAGIGGYMDATAKSMGINPRDPNEAIPAAAQQIRERLDKGMSIEDAVKEHFAGPDRKKWGDKTAAYGQEVLAKAGAIGQELYGDAADASAAPAPSAPATPDLGPEQNKFAPTRMRRADYEKEFRAMNPRAGQSAVDNAMAQYDQQVQEADAARAKAKTIGPKPIQSPEQFFDARLNERLQGPANGVVPQLPGREQPLAFPATGTQRNPSTFDTVAGNLTGGALNTLIGAVAGSARLLGADDVADEWEAGKKQVQDRQKELGGDTMKGKVAGLIGGILPAMANASESMVLQFATNSGLFGVPAFQDTYKAKLAEGQSKKLAAIHAFESFGLNTVGPMIMPRGVGALVGKLGGAEAAGLKGAALGLGQAAGEGVAFSGVSTAMDKGTDVLAGQKNDRAWIDPEDMAVQALGFGAMRAGHMAPHAVDAALDKAAPGYQVGRALQEDAGNLHFDPASAQGIAADRLSAQNYDPRTIAPQDTARAPGDIGPSPMTRMAPAAPAGPLTAAIESAAPEQAGRVEPTLGDAPAALVADAPRAGAPSVKDQLLALRPLEPKGPMEAAIQDAANQHAANPAPLPEQPQEAPQPPALDTLPLEDLRAQLKQVAAAVKANPEQRQELTKQRQAIEKEIGARAKQAKADSKPAEEPLKTGPFEDMAAANKMMLRYAEQTGQPHEVVGSEGKFEVKPIGEQGDGIHSAGAARGLDGHGRSGQSADAVGRADAAGSGEAGPGAGGSGRSGGSRPVAGKLPDAGADRVGADGAADAQPALTFKTSKGSTYTVNLDGTTTRDKAARAEHPGEQGVQQASKRTVYMTRDEMAKLAEIQAKGGARKGLVFHDGDKKVAIRYLDGKDAGKVEKRTVASFASEPSVGLYPVESWGDGYSVHFGNEITEINAQPALKGKRDAVSKAGKDGAHGSAGVPDAQPGAAVAAGKQGADVAVPAVDAKAAAPALTEPSPYHKVNPFHAYAFPDAARAEAFMEKKSVDREQFEAVQTGPVRWQVKPRAAQVQDSFAKEVTADVPESPQVPEEAQAARSAEAAQPANAGSDAAPAAGKDAAPAAAEPVTRDTRNTGVRFHGTSRELPGGKPNNEFAMSGDNRNIYGQGFYTTDAADISEGYMRKGKGGAPTLYEIKERGEPKLYDMEQPMTPETRTMAERAMGDAFPEHDIDGKPITTLRELFDEYRSDSQNNGLTRDEVQETFDAIRYNLEQEGYAGYRHIGGLKTKKTPHDVRIYWTPEDHIDVEKSDLAKYKGEAKTSPAPTQVKSEAVKTPAKPKRKKAAPKAAPAAEQDEGVRYSVSGESGMARVLYKDRDTILDKDGRLKVDLMDAEADLTDAEFNAREKDWQQAVQVPLSGNDTAKAIGKINSMQWFHGSADTSMDRPGLHSAGGLFLASDRAGAQHYAGKDGRVYESSIQVKKPFFVATSDVTADMESSGQIKKLAAQGFDAIVPLDYGDLVVLKDSALADQQNPSARYSVSGDQTDTPAFKKWFGASKVVDKDGKPLVLYHGTNADVSELKSKGELHPDLPWTRGIYFTADPEYASRYAEGDGANVMPVFLKMENPKIVTDSGFKTASISQEQIDQLRAEGHDGIINHADDEYIVFDSKQVKSATGNDGKFSQENADIRYSVSGDKAETLEDVRDAWDAAGIKNFISERNGVIHLSQIVVPKEARGEGAGTKAMRQLVEYANRTGQRIVLTPSSDFGGSKGRLVEFYKRFGFVENKGRAKDFEVSESMYRDPASPDIRYSVAYHGSPYKFDKFTVEHIGSGEGNQAFGWGLYFAGDRAIADYYRKALSGLEGADGKPLDLSKASPQAQQFINEQVAFGTDPAQIPAVAKSYADASRRWDAQDVAKGGQPSRTQYIEAMDEVAKLVEGAKRSDGQLYEANIPERDSMLHWDDPISEQPPAVAAALAELADKYGYQYDKYTGGEAYRALTSDLNAEGLTNGRNPQQAASELLHSLGIDGIAYLDHNSRGNDNDIRNYVVFDDAAISILKTHYSIAERQQAWPALREVSPMVQALADKGAIVLHQDASTLPVKGKAPAGTQALTTADGTIHVVANALGDNARGIILHEAFHAGTKALIGSAAWDGLNTRLGALYRQGEKSSGAARVFWDAARARVATAKAKGAVSPGMEHEEFGAYAIEEYAKAPLTVRKWVDDLIGAVKAWALRRFGKQLGDVTPAQLSSLAKLALLDKVASAARERSMQPSPESMQPSFSSDSSKTIEVDGKRRPIENSSGKLIAPDMHQQMAFWRWAADTKVADAQGRPEVVYHGTIHDFSEFNPRTFGTSTDAGTEGQGFYFSSNPDAASSNAEWVSGFGSKPGANVMPVYLSIQNPYRINKSNAPRGLESNPKAAAKFTRDLIKQGYDGVEYTLMSGDKTYVAFKSEQVKSATGNDGSFSGDTPDIRYSVAGAPATPTVDPTMRERLARTIARPVAGLRSIAHDGAMLVVPMEAGAEKARAMAKEFANNNRAATAQWTAFDTVLRKNYTEPELAAMWHAADQENDLRREGRTSTTEGLAALPVDQRETVELLHAYGEQLWERAKRAGLVADDSEGVHYWTPRVAANIYADGSVDSIRPQAGEFSKDAKNLRTSASSTKQRKHETTAESEAALKAKLGDDAAYVKNIRVMPMAMAQLEKAIAGRTLVNQIKAHGQVAGQELISDTGGPNFVTFDHPALKRFIPKTDWHPVEQSVLAARGYDLQPDGVYRNGEKLVSYRVKADGSVEQLKPMLDSDGKPVLLPAPLFVHKDFAGPLRAVFSSSLGNESVDKVYRGFMQLKGTSMSMIMISPMTHNAVIWGKAMPSLLTSMGWKSNLKNLATAGGYTYVVGHQFRKDHALVNELIQGGLVPIGGRGMNPDLPAIAEGIKPGRSLLAKALGKVLDPVSPKAGDMARKGVDALGHFWHETLLWDRIGDMQVGMAVQMRNHFMDMGIDQYSATRIAAHFANRYAGAIPQEAMSQGAHALLNMTLFSKSFTMTNLGAMKDPFVGLPADVRAQIKQHAAALNRALGKTDIEAEDAAGKVLKQAQSATRKKAAVILMADFGAMAVITSLTQAYFKSQSGDEFLKDLKERLHALGAKLDKENPLPFLGPTWGKAGLPAAFLRHPFENLGMLSQTHDNPHGKQDRIRVGEDEHGNTYYMRLPVGKVVEEMKSYTNLSTGSGLLDNKLSPLVKGIVEAKQNKDFQGRTVYDEDTYLPVQVAQAVGHILKAQVPFDDIVALKNVFSQKEGKGDKVKMLGGEWSMDEAKLLGTATGLSVSKLSGGDAVAEMRYLDRQRTAALHNVLPDVRDAVRRGDEAEAEKLLEKAGLDDKEISRTLKNLDDPSKISKSREKRFERHATDEQMDRLDKMRK